MSVTPGRILHIHRRGWVSDSVAFVYIHEGSDETMVEDVPLEESNNDVAGGDARSVSPLRALRSHCLWCCNGSAHEVTLCPAMSCPLWPFRFGHRPTAEEKAAVADVKFYPLERPSTGAEFHDKGGTALKAIRRRCMDCSGGSQVTANACTASDCDLHKFRRGKNPNFKISEERRLRLAASLAATRGKMAANRD
jgi:hypothetical protein